MTAMEMDSRRLKDTGYDQSATLWRFCRLRQAAPPGRHCENNL
jgi:hypothetical protein